jgi:hypothetical protein
VALTPGRPRHTSRVVDPVKGHLDPVTKGRKTFVNDGARDTASPRPKHERRLGQRAWFDGSPSRWWGLTVGDGARMVVLGARTPAAEVRREVDVGLGGEASFYSDYFVFEG